MDTAESLLAEFKTYPAIPNDRLYNLLINNRGRYIDFLNDSGHEALIQSGIGSEVVRRCEQDLLWLAGSFCWETNPEGAGQPQSYNRILEETHGRLCRFFVQKNKEKSIAEQDQAFKIRELLWPRGGLKSTLGIAEAAQWVLNFPQIRICFLTAEDDLAFGLLEEFKGHFVVNPDTPTLMNIFFPEWCVNDEDFVISKGYRCPAWYNKHAGTKRKESTVNAISIGSNISGQHFEVIMADDVVSNRNSSSPEFCKKITKDFAVNKKTLRPWGYVYKIGTRYVDDDMYGEDIEKASVGDVVINPDGPCVETLLNSTLKIKILTGRAIVIKPEVRQKLQDEAKTISYLEAGKEGCDILLPDLLTYEYLLKEWQDDEFVMEGQYNQNPRLQTATVFDLSLLQKNTIPATEIPLRGPISQTWDFAFSPKKKRDFCTCATVVWDDKGGMVVLDLVRQRFTPLDLAKAVVSAARRWKPFVIGIEKAAGSQLLEPTIISEALKTGDPHTISVCSKIDWIQATNEEGAKMARMASLHPWLVDRNLRFVAHLPYLQQLYQEFQKCLLSKNNKNDIPDVLSRQLSYAPRMARAVSTGLGGKLNLLQTAPMPSTKEQMAYNLLYGPWITESEAPADAFGRLGMGEIPQPLVEEAPAEPEPVAQLNSFSDGLSELIGY